jgi:hypothetical protein
VYLPFDKGYLNQAEIYALAFLPDIKTSNHHLLGALTAGLSQDFLLGRKNQYLPFSVSTGSKLKPHLPTPQHYLIGERRFNDSIMACP